MNEKEPYPPGEGVVKWISTSGLQSLLNSHDITIVDCQPDIHDYIFEHIPGAVYLPPKIFRLPRKGTPGYYIDQACVESFFRRIGLKNDTPAVVYAGVGQFKGWGDGLEQTMVAYSLARFGHNKVYILDGGIDKWRNENREVTKKFPEINESKFNVKIRREYYLEYDEFKAAKDNENVVLLDARPANFYEGQGPWIKPGHIPGAINLPWASLMDDDNKRLLKPEKEIREIISKHNITADKTVICSCGTGREATNEFLLFKYFLKYPNVKIYEGSFTEWVSLGNPTVIGKNPR